MLKLSKCMLIEWFRLAQGTCASKYDKCQFMQLIIFRTKRDKE